MLHSLRGHKTNAKERHHPVTALARASPPLEPPEPVVEAAAAPAAPAAVPAARPGETRSMGAVRVWLHRSGFTDEGVADAFVEDGYDDLETIADMNRAEIAEVVAGYAERLTGTLHELARVLQEAGRAEAEAAAAAAGAVAEGGLGERLAAASSPEKPAAAPPRATSQPPTEEALWSSAERAEDGITDGSSEQRGRPRALSAPSKPAPELLAAAQDDSLNSARNRAVLDAAPALPRTGGPFTDGIALVRLGMKADASFKAGHATDLIVAIELYEQGLQLLSEAMLTSKYQDMKSDVQQKTDVVSKRLVQLRKRASETAGGWERSSPKSRNLSEGRTSLGYESRLRSQTSARGSQGPYAEIKRRHRTDDAHRQVALSMTQLPMVGSSGELFMEPKVPSPLLSPSKPVAAAAAAAGAADFERIALASSPQQAGGGKPQLRRAMTEDELLVDPDEFLVGSPDDGDGSGMLDDLIQPPTLQPEDLQNLQGGATMRSVISLQGPATLNLTGTDIGADSSEGGGVWASLSADELSLVLSHSQTVTFNADEVLLHEGLRVAHFFILKVGVVEVSRRFASDDGKVGRKVLARFGPGCVLGENNMLKSTFAVTVTAQVQSIAIKVPQQTLLLLARETRKRLADAMSSLADSRSLVDMTTPAAGNYIAEEDLHFEALLGRGAFSAVSLVKHKATAEIFALKVMNKRFLEARDQRQHAKNEKECMLVLRHKSPFVVQLHKTFQTDANICMLLELAQGGELFSQLAEGNPLSSTRARFYLSSVVLGLSAMHGMRVIYRDLKPENILIDAKGYCKLADFGFAKQLEPDGRTYTRCGTPEYVAPEMLTKKGHNAAVDLWSLGVLVYEVTNGTTPFEAAIGEADGPMATYKRMLRFARDPKTLQYASAECSAVAKDLILGLLEPVPSVRLGVGDGGSLQAVKDHEFFAGLGWKSLAAGKMAAPWKPSLNTELDTQYFECDGESLEPPQDEAGDGKAATLVWDW